MFAARSFFVLALVSGALADSATPDLKVGETRLSDQLCQQLQKSPSRIFYHVFCAKSPLPVHEPRPLPVPAPPPLPGGKRMGRFSSEICDRLCSEGSGGAVCNCNSGLPPAVKPPPAPPAQPMTVPEQNVRARLHRIPRFPLPPP
jgi:hypothetical protein